jgi:hypothetical protein
MRGDAHAILPCCVDAARRGTAERYLRRRGAGASHTDVIVRCGNFTDPPPLVALLRPRRERPRDGRAAEQHNELAPFQLIELHLAPISQGRTTGYRTGGLAQAPPFPLSQSARPELRAGLPLQWGLLRAVPGPGRVILSGQGHRGTCGGSVRGEVLVAEVLTARHPRVLILKLPFSNPTSPAGTSFTPDMSNPSRRERDDED